MSTLDPKQKIKVTPAMRQELQALFDQFLDKPFRRSDLLARVKRRIRSPSQAHVEHIANAIMKEAAKAGQIARHGHLHWVRVTQSPGNRQLRSGRLVPEQADTVILKVETHVPSKYVLVDLETGDLWEGTPRGSWTRASAEALDETVRLVNPTTGAKRR